MSGFNPDMDIIWEVNIFVCNVVYGKYFGSHLTLDFYIAVTCISTVPVHCLNLSCICMC